MENRLAQLRYKEVVSVSDGSRFGFVGDMEVDLDTGRVTALVVPGRLRLLGLLGREEDRYIRNRPLKKPPVQINPKPVNPKKLARMEKAAANAAARAEHERLATGEEPEKL